MPFCSFSLLLLVTMAQTTMVMLPLPDLCPMLFAWVVSIGMEMYGLVVRGVTTMEGCGQTLSCHAKIRTESQN